MNMTLTSEQFIARLTNFEKSARYNESDVIEQGHHYPASDFVSSLLDELPCEPYLFVRAFSYEVHATGLNVRVSYKADIDHNGNSLMYEHYLFHHVVKKRKSRPTPARRAAYALEGNDFLNDKFFREVVEESCVEDESAFVVSLCDVLGYESVDTVQSFIDFNFHHERIEYFEEQDFLRCWKSRDQS